MSATSDERAGISRRLTLIMAAACGLVVANLYYAQPLLHTISQSLHVSTAEVGLLVTATQIGYAAGLLLLVPLGDLYERRRLLAAMLAVTTLGLIGAALAPSLAALAIALACVGLTSVVAQILVPFAATLAAEHERGRVVGTVMSGLLVGILLARTASGLLAAAAGWRAVYLIAAGLMLVLAAVLWRELPRVRQPVDLRYRALLASVVADRARGPLVLRRGLLGALGFAGFSVFWTSAAFELAGPPYNYGEGVIGLFGLLGVAGALMASYAGRLADAGHTQASRGAMLALMAGSFGLLAWGGHHLAPFVIGVVALDLAVQGSHILNQSDIYGLRPQSRSRITTIYMTCYFAGGAAGSALASAVYATGGWSAVCALGGGLGLVGFAVWLAEIRWPVRQPEARPRRPREPRARRSARDSPLTSRSVVLIALFGGRGAARRQSAAGSRARVTPGGREVGRRAGVADWFRALGETARGPPGGAGGVAAGPPGAWWRGRRRHGG